MGTVTHMEVSLTQHPSECLQSIALHVRRGGEGGEIWGGAELGASGTNEPKLTTLK